MTPKQSREIKFRAWFPIEHYSEPHMAYLDVNDEFGGNSDTWQLRHITNPEPDGPIYMQYTGLLDRNGVEIYEGDIVNYGIGYKGANQRQQSGIVTWDIEGAHFRIKDTKTETGNSWSAYLVELWCEVIGNIWENGDLLS